MQCLADTLGDFAECAQPQKAARRLHAGVSVAIRPQYPHVHHSTHAARGVGTSDRFGEVRGAIGHHRDRKER